MAAAVSHTRALTLSENDLLCKNQCGFYGNPLWDGYCSKCRKDQQALDLHRLPSATKPAATSSPSRFNQFEPKKRAQTDRRPAAVKSIFRKSDKPHADTAVAGSSPLTSFLRTNMKSHKEAALDICKRISQIKDYARYSAGRVSDQEISDNIQTFYNELRECFRTRNRYKGISEATATTVLDLVEQHVGCAFHMYLFSPPEDEQKDLHLQTWIRSLHWIKSEILGSAISENDKSCQTAVDLAIGAMFDLQTQRAPIDKLKFITKCCRHILEALRLVHGGNPASADEFLPALIYLVLRSNPPLLHSNIQFITRYADSSRLCTGEDGYYFTNLCCAVSFIEKLDHKAINMTKEDFDDYMSGKHSTHSTDLIMPEGIRVMNTVLSDALELEERLNKITENAQSFKAKVDDFEAEMGRDIEEVLKRCPWQLKPSAISVQIDAGSQLDSSSLPKLIEPIVRHSPGVVSDVKESISDSVDNSDNVIPCADAADNNITVGDSNKSQVQFQIESSSSEC